jgi:ATP-dependent DNA helicase RecQ
VLDDNKQDLSPILEQKLLDNKIKVLVATSALGMGYDKPDLNFVIHYQAPGSAIAYYQQVGRAGRELPESYGVLLHGSEEDEILDYFMREAFPTEDEEKAVLGFLNTVTLATQGQICRKLNMRSSRLEKALKHLLIDGYIEKNKSDYSRTVKAWTYDQQRKDQVQATRIRERDRMITYISHDGCLMRFIANELDDPTTQDCGICVNCRQGLLPIKPSQGTVQKALEFLHQDYVIIDPRKRWPNGLELSVNLQSKPTIVISKGEVIEQGRALGYLENAGWGSVIRRCIKDNTTVPEDVINAALYLLTKQWAPSPFPEWITYIQSISRSKVIVDFAKRLGAKLRIPVLDVIAISNTSKTPIYKYENSQQQVENSINNWSVKSSIRQSPVLLIDDFVNSRWTLTIVGRMLRINGTEKVYPFTLGSVKDTK